MKTYLPKIDSLRTSQGVWCVEAAWMDRIAEAYYLGGDFDGRNDCFFYYMVWNDPDFGVWNVGYNLHGQADAPFSKLRCVLIARQACLRDALAAAEQHAFARLTCSERTATSVIPNAIDFYGQVTSGDEISTPSPAYS